MYSRLCVALLGFAVAVPLTATTSLAADEERFDQAVFLAQAEVPSLGLPAGVTLQTASDEVLVEALEAAIANMDDDAVLALLGSLASAAPDRAALIAGTAARLRPNIAADIAAVAVSAAPEQVDAIVARVVASVPSASDSIVEAVANANPDISPDRIQVAMEQGLEISQAGADGLMNFDEPYTEGDGGDFSPPPDDEREPVSPTAL